LSLIKTETTEIIEDGKIKHISKPDVIANNEIIVEVETLRGKAFDKNVYLQLVSNMIMKSDGWTKTNLKELWIVVPGFEIARNYYQLMKSVSHGFDKWDYVIDRWGLFNPPGVGPFDKDPDEDITRGEF